MTKEFYLENRATLINEAQALIDSGDLENAAAKTKDVEALDAKFENEAKMLANLETMKGSAKVTNISKAAGVFATTAQTTESEDILDSMEYRKAFMNYVTKGSAIPSKFKNLDESTTSTDAATAIPTTTANRIIESMESIGMILPLVTRTSYASGVVIPTATVKPVASWVNENATSDRQKKGTASITFSKFKLRCEISISAETSAMAVPAFESAFVRQVSEAMVKAQETAIVSIATGSTSPKGILAETPTSGQALTASELSYDLLVEAEGALPAAYENNAIWCMTKKTFMAFYGMTDANGQPIARVNYGMGGKPERSLLGRSVILCDYIDSFSTSLTSAKIFAFIFNFSDYVLNTVYDLGITRKQDWDTEENLTKAVMSVDGKVVDVGSLVTIAKA